MIAGTYTKQLKQYYQSMLRDERSRTQVIDITAVELWQAMSYPMSKKNKPST